MVKQRIHDIRKKATSKQFKGPQGSDLKGLRERT